MKYFGFQRFEIHDFFVELIHKTKSLDFNNFFYSYSHTFDFLIKTTHVCLRHFKVVDFGLSERSDEGKAFEKEKRKFDSTLHHAKNGGATYARHRQKRRFTPTLSRKRSGIFEKPAAKKKRSTPSFRKQSRSDKLKHSIGRSELRPSSNQIPV
eukprot:UN22443